MKHNILFYGFAALTLMLSGCVKEMDYYNAVSTEPTVGINDDSLILDGKSETAKIKIESNMWWKASVTYESGSSEEWVSLSPESGYGDIDITVSSTRNYTSSPRTAKIIVEGNDKNTSFKKEFTLTQDASSPYIEIKTVADKGTLEVPIVKSSNTLEILSNGDWDAESDKSWCTLTTDGKAGTTELTVDCSLNNEGVERTANIVLKSKKNPEVKYGFKVVQNDEFSATVIVVTKTPKDFSASWDEIVGAEHYEIIVKDASGTEVGTINAGTATSIDLAADPIFATPSYAGYVKLSVKTLSEDPSVFSVSEEVESNSHFTSGKGTKADPFVIGDPESLANITKANKVLSGAYYKLDYTPDMSKGFTPVCSAKDAFAGNFDGNGKTISGWKETLYADKLNCVGFFGAIAKGASVKNLTFSGCEFTLDNQGGSVSSTNNGFGFVAGYNSGTVSDITVTGCSISAVAGTSPLYVGAIAGENAGTISDCTAKGGRISAAADRNKTDEFNVGGITGYNTDKGVIKSCVNGNEILAMNNVGGIAGYCDGHIEKCGNTGKITANYYFGGIAGYVKTTGKATFQIKDSYNTGTLVMDEPAGQGRGAAYMGGITSRIHCTTSKAIVNCWNSGDMIVGTSVSSSNMRIGGLVGHVNNTGTMENCYFSGTVTIAGKVNYGGLVGEFADKATKIINCYSVGKVVKTDSASGTIANALGKGAKSPVITSCYALDNGGKGFDGGSYSKIGAECGLKTAAELKDQATFSGWDFSSVWTMGTGDYLYPVLK